MGAVPEPTQEPRHGPGQAGGRAEVINPSNDGLRAVVEGWLPHTSPSQPS